MSKLEQQILEVLSDPDYRPLKRPALARQIGLKKKQLPRFHDAVDALLAAKRIREGKKGRIRIRHTTDGLISGIIKRTGRGTGFLVPHERTPDLRGEDVFIAERDMLDAHTGDEVLVRLTSRRRSGGQRCGRIEQVLERASNTFVGTYFEQAGQGFVQVDGTIFVEPIYVGDPGAKGVKPDDKVVIDMLRFPSHFQAGEAVLAKVLGPRGEPGIDTLTIIHEFGLPDEFPETVVEDARLQAENFDETSLTGRRDLTGDVIVTIDPVDARDFDDAISLERTPDGHWHLGVHIADVAHFVPQGSLLDIEAQKRGTSVYLPQRVLPMLPEVISNGLASLQQGKVRYAKSVFIEFNAEGIPLHTEFDNSAIKVTKRFAYEQVMPIIREPEKHRGRVGAKVRALLARMFELAMMLRKRRFGRGALEMGLGEIKIDFDKQGLVTGAHEAVHDESHQIIEEFMLAANIAVARALVERDMPFLRRAHGDPDERKLKAFSEFVRALGFELDKHQSRPDLQALLNSVRGTPQEHAVNYGLLRSLKQAEYSPMNQGHYALAEDDYCHFTSPIRRYPDLTIHRIIGDLARGKQEIALHEDELLKLGKNCSITERRAEKAERELTRLKLLRFMSERIGEQMDAIITGVQSFGLFCQGVDVPAEGLVHISSLGNDSYYFDPTAHSLSGHRKGNHFRLGDRVRIEVARVDLDRRELDFRLVSKAADAPRKSSGPKAKRKRPSRKKKSDDTASSKPAKKKSGRKTSTRKKARRKKKPAKRRR